MRQRSPSGNSAKRAPWRTPRQSRLGKERRQGRIAGPTHRRAAGSKLESRGLERGEDVLLAGAHGSDPLATEHKAHVKPAAAGKYLLVEEAVVGQILIGQVELDLPADSGEVRPPGSTANALLRLTTWKRCCWHE